MGKYSKGIRKLKISKNKKDCYICDKYKCITELHHIVRVADISEHMDSYIRDDETLLKLMQGVWLCPNHHTILHKLLSKKYLEVIFDLDELELSKYRQLLTFSKELYDTLPEYTYDETGHVKKDFLRIRYQLDMAIYMIEELIKRLSKVN